MNAFVLYHYNGDNPTIFGVYSTLALAQAARDAKIDTFVASQNAIRDAAYAAGEYYEAVLTVADVLPQAFIVQKQVDE